jgi:diguanylate cyclase (GGDEF)-like protein
VATVLVVDDDTDIARFIEINLRLEGFDVRVAHDGEQAEESIDAEIPDLVLLDVMMPKVDGVELCRRLRANPATANLPVIMLTAKSLSADKVVGLTAGADDYIIKPFDTLELVARVRSTLRRNAEMRAVSPLTGLPGNHRIEEELADRVLKAEPFAVLYLDLDNFKAFNDCYGFLRGDEVITLLATAARRAVMEVGEPAPFLGHIGGDDFVIVSLPEQSEILAKRVVDIFDSSAPRLHDQHDADRGYIEVTDRQGKARRFPLVSVSIGIAMSGNRMFADKREVVDVATEMKKVAKTTLGSSVAIDRRGTLRADGTS